MHKPNLKDCSRGELLIMCAAALDKLERIERTVSEEPKATVLVAKGRSVGKTSEMINAFARDNHRLRLQLEEVKSFLPKSDSQPNTMGAPLTTPPFPFPKFNGLTVMCNNMLPPMTMMVGPDVYSMLCSDAVQEVPNA